MAETNPRTLAKRKPAPKVATNFVADNSKPVPPPQRRKRRDYKAGWEVLFPGTPEGRRLARERIFGV